MGSRLGTLLERVGVPPLRAASAAESSHRDHRRPRLASTVVSIRARQSQGTRTTASPSRRTRMYIQKWFAAAPLPGRVGSEVRHAPVGALIGRQVAHHLSEKPATSYRNAAVEEDAPIAGPAGAFTLRAVGGYLAGVAPEAPVGDLVEAVQPLVAAPEPPRATQIGVHDDTGHVVGGQPPGVSLDPDVAEPVRGAVVRTRRPRRRQRRPGRPGPPRGRFGDGGEVVEGDVAGPVECFAVGQGRHRADRSQVAEAHPAVDVLAEVDDLAVGGDG